MKSIIGKEARETEKHEASPRLKKAVLTAGIAVLAVAVIAGSSMFYLRYQGDDDASPGGTAATERRPDARTQKPQGPLEESIAKAGAGQYDAAQTLLGEEVRRTGDSRSAHDLLLQQSANAYNAKKYNESLSYARKAIERHDNSSANKLAGRAAEKAGQLKVAQGYYQKALSKLPGGGRSRAVEEDDLRQSIERMKA